MLRPLSLVAALALAIVATACAKPAPPSSPSSSEIAPAPRPVDGKKAKALVASGAKLVDVRSPAEFSEKHIDGAVNVPVAEINNTDFGPKDRPVVVYCGSGIRSAKAADKLQVKGYINVYDLGAISSWDE